MLEWNTMRPPGFFTVVWANPATKEKREVQQVEKITKAQHHSQHRKQRSRRKDSTTQTLPRITPTPTTDTEALCVGTPDGDCGVVFSAE